MRRGVMLWLAVVVALCVPIDARAEHRHGQAPVAIDLTVQRLDEGTTGTALVSNGIPLPPGVLRAGQLDRVRVMVEGREQAAYLEALAGTHRDGSLRAVLVQFPYAFNSKKALRGQLVIGQPRGAPMLARPSDKRAYPVAVALPTSADYLVSTQLVGPTLTEAEAKRRGNTFVRYESEFERQADAHWRSEGYGWEQSNYYDRALVYYAWWVRTGWPEYWRRATMIAVDYRRRYLEHADYKATPHWSQLEGIALHYWMTGDEDSRLAVARVAEALAPYEPGIPRGEWDARIAARLLQSYLLSWKLSDAAHGQAGGAQTSWGARLDAALPAILRTQSDDGAYRNPAFCNMQLNYMTGLLDDALIRYYSDYRADPRIPSAVKRAVDYLWDTQWIPGETRAFRYLSGSCAKVGDEVPAPDLNNLMVTGFGFVYWVTGDPTYRERGDEVLAGAVEGAWLNGSKQFNQQYTSSFRYLAYREERPAAAGQR